MYVTVNQVNDAPIADDVPDATLGEDTGSLTITGTDVTHDVDIATNSDELTLSVTSGASHGTAVVTTDGNLSYTPSTDWNGPDEFVYRATDKGGLWDEGTVTIEVTQVNDAPVTDNETVSVNEDSSILIDVLDGDTDVDMDPELNYVPEDDEDFALQTLSISLADDDLRDPSHGTIAIENGQIRYTPNLNYNGPDEFEYNCSDGITTTPGTVYVTVNQVNDSPVANDDIVTTPEDTDITPVNVLDNDTDTDTDTELNLILADRQAHADLTVTSATLQTAGSGTFDYTSSGVFTFDPADDWFGRATIHYFISDGRGGTADAYLYVDVSSVNDLPQFAEKPAAMNLTEDEADGVSAFTVSDVETPAEDLEVTFVNSSNTGLIDGSCVSLWADETSGARTVTINPKDNQNGVADITLRVTDGDNEDVEYSFHVTVEKVNDTPVADDVPDATFTEDAGSLTITGTDVTHDVDIATNNDKLTLSVTSGASHGTAVVTTDGNLVYTPGADWNGTDSFVYRATDEDGAWDEGTVTIEVAQANDAPVTDNETVSVDEDNSILIDVLDGDTDKDQNPLLNAHYEDEELSVSLAESDLRGPSHGTITIDEETGYIRYTPGKDYNGLDEFEYNCSDGEALTKGTVYVTVNQVNDAPMANADTASTPDETPVSINVLTNDTDVDTREDLNLNVRHSTSTFSVTDYGFIGDAHGTLSEENGVITYTPSLNFVGTQQISYTLDDGHGETDTGVLSVTVNAENDAPSAFDDAMNMEEDNSATINVLDNDRDQDPGDTLSFNGFTESTSGMPGTFETASDGTVSFTPNANYHGSFTIGYQVRDAGGLTSDAAVTITVSAANDTPVAQDGTSSTAEDTQKTVDVAALVSDADILTDGDTYKISVEADGVPKHGTVTVSGTQITYTPATDWNGTDSFTYTATDEAGAFDEGTITMTVTPVNDAPVAAADTLTLDEDTTASVDALDNDTDVDTNGLLNETTQAAPTLLSVGTALHGTARITDGQIEYSPSANYNGLDSFTYTITDGSLTSSATVSVTVRQVNDPVDAVNDTAQTTDEDPVTIDVLANDTDVDTDDSFNLGTQHSRDDFTIQIAGSAQHGATRIVEGRIVYTPEDTYAGVDSFTYTMSDGHGSTDSATVTVTVLSANDPPETPVVSSPEEGDRAGGSSTVDVVWSCFDIDGDTLVYALEYYDGEAWHEVEDGLEATRYEFAIPSSQGTTDGLRFRVKASDAEFTTDYGYSGAMSVDRDAPLAVTVTMKTSDGRNYTEGTWTNKSVTVTGVSADDANEVTFRYALDGDAFEDADDMTVDSGVHSVYILATDVFDNAASFGGYLARVDKQAPVQPAIAESASGANIVLQFTFRTDPGGSGNDYLVLPDGTTVNAKGTPEYSVSRNGTYTFTLYDAAGNKTTFTYTVSSVDTSAPVITCDSGSYRIGDTTQDTISVRLTFTDGESSVTARGYQLSSSAAPGTAYRSYTGVITISSPGTYYIHAYAKNAFGLTTYITFGPFIVEEAPVAAAVNATPTPGPEYGDVVIQPDDVDEEPGDTVYLRLPGEDWSQTLTLENVTPGDYLIEAMDKDGNVRTVTVHVTMRDIVARSLRGADAATRAWLITGLSALALALILLLLFGGSNVTVRVFGLAIGEEKRLRTMRRIRFRRKVITVKLDNKQVRGGKYATIKLAKHLTRRMRGRWVVVEVRGREVLREQVPEDAKKAFNRRIPLEDS